MLIFLGITLPVKEGLLWKRVFQVFQLTINLFTYLNFIYCWLTNILFYLILSVNM